RLRRCRRRSFQPKYVGFSRLRKGGVDGELAAFKLIRKQNNHRIVVAMIERDCDCVRRLSGGRELNFDIVHKRGRLVFAPARGLDKTALDQTDQVSRTRTITAVIASNRDELSIGSQSGAEGKEFAMALQSHDLLSQ